MTILVFKRVERHQSGRPFPPSLGPSLRIGILFLGSSTDCSKSTSRLHPRRDLRNTFGPTLTTSAPLFLFAQTLFFPTIFRPMPNPSLVDVTPTFSGSRNSQGPPFYEDQTGTSCRPVSSRSSSLGSLGDVLSLLMHYPLPLLFWSC